MLKDGAKLVEGVEDILGELEFLNLREEAPKPLGVPGNEGKRLNCQGFRHFLGQGHARFHC